MSNPKTADLILENGEVIKINFSRCDSQLSFTEIAARARESIASVAAARKLRTQIVHRFSCVTGVCRDCGVSRARFLFSRKIIRCND